MVKTIISLWSARWERPFISKTLLVMKLTVILSTVFFLNASAKAVSQNVTFTGERVPLKIILSSVKQQTGFAFLYPRSVLENFKPVSISATDIPLEQFLTELLKSQPLAYKLKGKNILITPKFTVEKSIAEEPEELYSPIRGRILDEDGKPLSGATITIKQSKNVAIANADGTFNLDVKEGDILVISYVGYQSKELKVTAGMIGSGEVSVVLAKVSAQLDEVQIIAYGQTSRRLQTGNVSTIKAADIERQPVSNPLLALQGRVPGLFITQATGMPGSKLTVRLQGQNSIANGLDPFYVIDGVPYYSEMLPSLSGIQEGGNPMNFINPLDIESIDVLKDADATAIYGSRAANGAILITTKKARAGQTRVEVNLQNGFGQVANKVKMMNTEQYLALRKDAYVNDNLPVPNNTTTPEATNYDLTVWDQNRYTDWQKELIGGKAKYMDAQMSVSGGNANTQLLVGLNYHKETTVFPGDLSDNKGAVHFNASHSSDNRKFRMQLSVNYMFDQSNLIAFDLTEKAVKLVPNAPSLYNEDGSLNWAPLPNGVSTWSNPLNMLEGKYINKTHNLVSNAELSYEILKGLHVKSSFGYNKLESDETSILPQTYFPPESSSFNYRSASYSNKASTSWIIEPQLTYIMSKNFGTLDFLLGTTFQQTTQNLMSFNGSGYSSDEQLQNIKAATLVTVGNTIQSVYNYNAIFGRINYNRQDKYLLTLSARRDGSSRFGPENMFNTFYSIGGAWIFSNEQWFKNQLNLLSFGKLKLSYGTSGNDQIGDYSFMGLYSVFGTDIPYSGIVSLFPERLTNPYLQWEETRKINIGLDLGFFNNHILLNANYYRNRSSNQLINYSLPIITGFYSISQNFDALVQNSGFELLINTQNVQTKNFTWSSSFNMTLNRNKLVEFPGLETSSSKDALVIGQPINISKVYHFGGVDPQTGEYRYIKADGTYTDWLLDWSADKTVIVNMNPKYYGGFQNTITYKGFTLDFLFQFVKQIGRDTYSKFGGAPGFFNTSAMNNQPVKVLYHWRKPGDLSDIQRVSTLTDYTAPYLGLSNGQHMDASYIRLKNLSLSCTLPTNWAKKAYLKEARLFVQGQNLWTVTNFTGFDPETLGHTLPPLRAFTFGLRATL